ncbi:hypothetical protein ACXWPL_09665, partial [Streptococcus pyogenes]
QRLAMGHRKQLSNVVVVSPRRGFFWWSAVGIPAGFLVGIAAFYFLSLALGAVALGLVAGALVHRAIVQGRPAPATRKPKVAVD